MSDVYTTSDASSNEAPTVTVLAGRETETGTYTGPGLLAFMGVNIRDTEDDDLTLTITFDSTFGNFIFPRGTVAAVVDNGTTRTYTLTGKSSELSNIIQMSTFDANDALNGSGPSDAIVTFGVKDADHDTISTGTVTVQLTDGGPAHSAPEISIAPGTEVTNAGYLGPDVRPFRGVALEDADDDLLTLTISFDPTRGHITLPWGSPFWDEQNGVRTYTLSGDKSYLTNLIQNITFDPNNGLEGSGPLDTIFTLAITDGWQGTPITASVTVAMNNGVPRNATPEIDVVDGTETTTTTYTNPNNVFPFLGVSFTDDSDELICMISYDDTYGDLILPAFAEAWLSTDPNTGLPAYVFSGSASELTDALLAAQFNPRDSMNGAGRTTTSFSIAVSDSYNAPVWNEEVSVVLDNGNPADSVPTVSVLPGWESMTSYFTSLGEGVFGGVSFENLETEEILTATISFELIAGDLLVPEGTAFQSETHASDDKIIKTFTFTGTASELTALMQLVVFKPDQEKINTGQYLIPFTISVTDGEHAPDVDDSIILNLHDEDVGGGLAEIITVDPGTETTEAIHTGSNVSPFVGVTFHNGGENEALIAVISFDNAWGDLVIPDGTLYSVIWPTWENETWGPAGTKTYVFNGTQTELNALMDQIRFDPKDDASGAVDTIFTIGIKDEYHSGFYRKTVQVVSADPVVPNAAPTIFVASGKETTDATDTGAPVRPFMGVSFDDSEDDDLTVAISFNPAGGDLVLPAEVQVIPAVDPVSGLVTYTFSGKKAALAALMDMLAFDPVRQMASSGKITTSFTITVQDDTHPAVKNESVSVVTTITDKNNAPSNLLLAGSADGVSVAESATEIGLFSAEDQDGDAIDWVFAQDGNPGGMFVIDGNLIKLAEGKHFDVDGPGGVSSYTIHVKALDGNGGETMKTFVIAVTNVNDNAPTAIRLNGETSLSIAENTKVDDLIGTLSAVDVDGDAIVSYEMENNEFFKVVKNSITGAFEVRLKAGVDYQTLAQRHHVLKITATDGKNTSTAQEILIDVANVNDAPTGLTLTNKVISESDASIRIGTLTAVDPDGDALSYLLVDAEGREVTDSSEFEIQAVRVNGVTTYRLATKGGIQVDADETRDVYVKAMDGNGGAVTEKFTITIKNVNHDPTDLVLSNTTVDESNSAMLIGTLYATDPDGDALSYLLVDDQGREVTDSSPFEIQAVRMSGNIIYRLATKTGIQVSADETRDVYVKVSDGHGGSMTKKFTVMIRNVEGTNQKPVIHVTESSAITTTTDMSGPVKPFMGVSFDDAEDDDLTVTISFNALGGDLVVPSRFAVDPVESGGNKTYTFLGKKAYLAALMDTLEFDPVQQSGNSGTVTTTFTISVKDARNAPAIDKSVQVVSTITDKNHSPINLSLGSSIVSENVPGGTVVGTLSAEDQDGSDILTYTLDDDVFYIDGTQIKVKNGVELDFETARSHQVTVSVTDGSATISKTFTIEVKDAVETLKGTSKANTLRGGIGSDILKGGYGNDMLTGGAGKDFFVFNSKLGTAVTDRKVNFDTIRDFNVADDSIWLDNAIFKKLGKKGTESKPVQLNAKFFKIGDKAKDSNDYVVYNKKTGILSYDADGSGAGEAIEIAKLAKNLKLTYKDFFVV